MPAIWKPTPAQIKAIREYTAAIDGFGPRAIRIEPGIRYNTDTGNLDHTSMNIASLTNDPDWNDTDLWSHASWADFKRGVELTEDGRAIVDFYYYSLGHWGELEGNSQVYVETIEGKPTIVKLDGTAAKPLETRI